MIRTTDNNCGKPVSSLCGGESIDDLRVIANKKVRDIKPEDNQDLLIFPQNWMLGVDAAKDKIFELGEKDGETVLTTNNVMGFIGRNDTMLTISSRFYPAGDDYFTHYMLCKALGINVVNLNFSAGKEDIHDFLPYLFPSYLRSALSRGLYKQYRRNEYNDANVRGAIDVNRHIKANIPFTGKIAYTTREHSYDNPVTQLIRHTIEYLRTRDFWHGILGGNADVRADVSQIESATPSYRRNDAQKVIKANMRSVNHPYFTKYMDLQKLCLRILRREKTVSGSANDRIYGLLFDGAWLWEEYLHRVFNENRLGWDHPDNRARVGGDDLFEDGQKIYPDFIKKEADAAECVGDAKYKFIDKRGEEAGRDDYFQLITYMYRYQCGTGFLLFPCRGEFRRDRRIKGRDGKCIELGLKIEQSARSFMEFTESMRGNEKAFIKALKIPEIQAV